MLFNSVEFIFVFLPIVFAGFFVASYFRGQRTALGWLLLASFFFYGWFHVSYLSLLFLSLLLNFFLGDWLGRTHAEVSTKHRKIALGAGVAVNLGLIGYFKYYNFFLGSITAISGVSWSAEQVLLPIGISFFTFQQIAYLVDRFDTRSENPRFLEYSLFISFFPQLVAGPIVHHKDLLPQFKEKKVYRFESAVFFGGLTLFFLGLFKKVVLADQFAVYSDQGFNAAAQGTTLTLFEAWGASLSYTFQLYFDFSGYADMAIGLAAMVGIQLPINFMAPYRSTSVIEFWRRWHMTLSRFLRDYLYFPLGGSRNGRARRYRNLFLTMLLGGFWHGAGWTFVFWGALHGVYLMVNHAWRSLVRRTFGRDIQSPFYSCFGWSVTMFSVVVGWVFFRADNFGTGMVVLRGMFGFNGAELPSQVVGMVPFVERWISSGGTVANLADGTVLGFVEMTFLLLLGFAIVLLGKTLSELSSRWRYVLLCLTFAFTIQRIIFNPEAAQFIYFQF